MKLVRKVGIISSLLADQALCFTTPLIIGPAGHVSRHIGSTAPQQRLQQLHVSPSLENGNNENMIHNNDNNSNSDNNSETKNPTATTWLLKKAKSLAAASLLTASLLLLNHNQHLHIVEPAMAAESRIVGQLQGSGLVFKDVLQIESFEDPKVKGVTIYISNFQRPLTERLTSNFLADPSYASVACAKTSKTVAIADTIAKGKAGEQVFEEARSLLFKTLRVQRIYDEETNTMVYVSFATRLDKSDDSNKARFKSSLCAVNLND